MVAVGGAGGRIDQPRHAGSASRVKQVQEAGHIDVMADQRFGKRARDGAKGGLVEDYVGSLDNGLARNAIADVALD